MHAISRPCRRLVTLLAFAVAGCASVGNTTTGQVDDRKVEYVLSRHAGPTVVFENGLGATLNEWADVIPSIADAATVFAYNRPGYGGSEAATTTRDGMHVVDELRALLRAKGLTPPYVLVGHSLGGLYMQYYARRYPEEVAALILVDSTHPQQFRGKGAIENWPDWVRLVFGMVSTPTQKAELAGINATGDAVLALPPPTGMPVLLLSAKQEMDTHSAFVADVAEKRLDMARLYPGAKRIWVDSGHNIPLEKPEAVVAAIRSAMRQLPTLPARIKEQ